MTQRVALPDGQWADLKPWLTHGEAVLVRKAWARASESLEDSPDVDTALVRAYVSAWHVIGRDGQPVPLDRVDDCPSPLVPLIVDPCLELWKGRADPNGLSASSPSTPPAQQ